MMMWRGATDMGCLCKTRAAQVRAMGVIDLQTIQRYLNFHYSVTLDLYGSDVSSNAANYFTNGLKGRFRETKLEDDHVLSEAEYPVYEVIGDKIVKKNVPARMPSTTVASAGQVPPTTATAMTASPLR